ncbi:MAG: MFS transporter [Planctomycetota bacterium]
MPATMPAHRMRPSDRRNSIVMAYANGGLWGLANGLASTTLVVYLAKEYGAAGMAISWLLAAPSNVGLLRLLTPYWLEKVKSRKIFCGGMFLTSAMLLFALPFLSAPGVFESQKVSIVVLIVLWIGCRVLEYIGAVAFWSWLGDLVPGAVRGHFVGRREAWLNAGKVLGIVVAAVGTQLWMNHCDAIQQPALKWRAYAGCSLASAVMLIVSLVPLLRMNDLPLHRTGDSKPYDLKRQLTLPFRDPKFRRLLRYGTWFSFSNGLVQTARFVLFAYELGVPFAMKKGLDATSRGSQSLIMPRIGAWIDQHGNVPVLAISQGVVALAPLFFLAASPDAKWWILGGYLCWIAFAGQNVAQPNLMLELSDPEEKTTYISAYYAWCFFALSVGSLLGGVLFDWLKQNVEPPTVFGWTLDQFAIIFIATFCLKSIGVYWATRIRE